jgi:hypothetical protein
MSASTKETFLPRIYRLQISSAVTQSFLILETERAFRIASAGGLLELASERVADDM